MVTYRHHWIARNGSCVFNEAFPCLLRDGESTVMESRLWGDSGEQASLSPINVIPLDGDDPSGSPPKVKVNE